jgi:hypothetical protein
MRFLRRFSVPFVGVFAITAISSLFAVAQTTVTPDTTILVRMGGVAQPNVRVFCTQSQTAVNTALSTTSVNGVVTSKGEARFNWSNYNFGVTDRSKFYAYVGGAWHGCLDDCDGPNPAPNHFHCELPHTLTLKAVNSASYPGGVGNVSIRITDMSNNDLGDPGFPFPYCIKPLTNQSGYAVACPSANTIFRIWSKESGSTVWKHAGEFYPLTSDADFTFSLNTTLVYPRQGDYVDSTNPNLFEWLPRTGAAYYELYSCHESESGLVYEGYTFNTFVDVSALLPGAWMWLVASYDSNSNLLDYSVVEFYAY